jgi:hypothetical protein
MMMIGMRVWTDHQAARDDQPPKRHRARFVATLMAQAFDRQASQRENQHEEAFLDLRYLGCCNRFHRPPALLG